MQKVTFCDTRDRPITVWYHRPQGYRADSPVLFILHGVKRNAKEYLDFWARETETRGALTCAPEFCTRFHPGASGYNLGGVVSENGEVLPRSEWSYSVLENLFDFVVSNTGHKTTSYLAFGHSAGAQYLYRAILLGCLRRVQRAVAANAGWYTLPSFSRMFPYGIANLDEDCRRQAFGKHLLLLLGEQDIMRDENLRQTPETMEQGEHRLERGKNVYQTAQAVAREIGWPFEWELQIVPNVGHCIQRVVPSAAEWLFCTNGGSR